MENSNAQVVVNEQTQENVVATAPEIAKETTEATAHEVAKNKVKTHEDIIKELIRNGAKRENDLKVKNVKTELYDEDDDSDEAPYRITFVVNRPIPCILQDPETSEYKETVSNNIFVSSYAIAGMIKEDADLAWLNSTIIKKRKLTEALFTGATIDTLVQIIKANTDYVSPFTTSADPTVTNKDHDWFVDHVVKIKLGKTGKRIADRIIDKMIEDED